MKKSVNKGFTLVELMIVVSIIAILASIGIVYYGNAEASARDAQRKRDLNTIAQALELYRSQHGSYPIPSGCTNGSWLNSLQSVSSGCTTGTTSSGYGENKDWVNWNGFTPTYMKNMPTGKLVPNMPYEDCFGNGSSPFCFQPYYGNGGFYSYTSVAVQPSAYTPGCPDGTYFILAVPLENIKDQQTARYTDPTLCDGIKLWKHKSPYYTIKGNDYLVLSH